MPFAGRLYVHVVKGVGLELNSSSSPKSNSSFSDGPSTPNGQSHTGHRRSSSASKRLATSATNAYNFLRRRSLTPAERAQAAAATSASASDGSSDSLHDTHTSQEQVEPGHPYLELRLGEQVCTTEPAGDGGVWGSDFRFAVVNSDSEGANHGLPFLTVICRQTNTEAVIGHVIIPVDRLPERHEIESWYQLYNSAPGTPGAVTGKGALFLRIRYDSVLLRSSSSLLTHTTSLWSSKKSGDLDNSGGNTLRSIPGSPSRGQSESAIQTTAASARRSAVSGVTSGGSNNGDVDGTTEKGVRRWKTDDLRVDTARRLRSDLTRLSESSETSSAMNADDEDEKNVRRLSSPQDIDLELDEQHGEGKGNQQASQHFENADESVDRVPANNDITTETMHDTLSTAIASDTATDSDTINTATAAKVPLLLKPLPLDISSLEINTRLSIDTDAQSAIDAGAVNLDTVDGEETHIPAVPPVPTRPPSSPTRASRNAHNKQKLSNVDLPCRIADYFVVIGVNAPLEPSFPDDDIAMVPEIRSRFPAQDHDNVALPVKLEWFCFPNGIRPIRVSTSTNSESNNANAATVPDPKFFCFTNSYSDFKLYGYCLICYEVLSVNSGHQGTATTLAPVCLCFLSRLALLDPFKHALLQLTSLTVLHDLAVKFPRSIGRLGLNKKESSVEDDISVDEFDDIMPIPQAADLVRLLTERVPMPVPGVLAIEVTIAGLTDVDTKEALLAIVDYAEAAAGLGQNITTHGDIERVSSSDNNDNNGNYVNDDDNSNSSSNNNNNTDSNNSDDNNKDKDSAIMETDNGVDKKEVPRRNSPTHPRFLASELYVSPAFLRANIRIADTLRCQVPRYGDLPPVAASLTQFVKWFSPRVVVDIWAAGLMECKILLHSRHCDRLAVTGESLISLLYPFRWQCAYIPLLPNQLLEYVQAPMSYMFGVHSDAMDAVPPADLDDVVVVDVDAGDITYRGTEPNGFPIPSLPNAALRRLIRALRLAANPELAKNRDTPMGLCRMLNVESESEQHRRERETAVGTSESDEKMRLVFLETISSLLIGYRECLFYLGEQLPIFNKQKFLRTSAHELLAHLPPSARAAASAAAAAAAKPGSNHRHRRGSVSVAYPGAMFLSRLFDTQAFEFFKDTQGSRFLARFHATFLAVSQKSRERQQTLELAANNSSISDSYSPRERRMKLQQKKQRDGKVTSRYVDALCPLHIPDSWFLAMPVGGVGKRRRSVNGNVTSDDGGKVLPAIVVELLPSVGNVCHGDDYLAKALATSKQRLNANAEEEEEKRRGIEDVDPLGPLLRRPAFGIDEAGRRMRSSTCPDPAIHVGNPDSDQNAIANAVGAFWQFHAKPFRPDRRTTSLLTMDHSVGDDDHVVIRVSPVALDPGPQLPPPSQHIDTIDQDETDSKIDSPGDTKQVTVQKRGTVGEGKKSSMLMGRRQHHHGKRPWQASTVADALGVPHTWMAKMLSELSCLVDAGNTTTSGTQVGRRQSMSSQASSSRKLDSETSDTASTTDDNHATRRQVQTDVDSNAISSPTHSSSVDTNSEGMIVEKRSHTGSWDAAIENEVVAQTVESVYVRAARERSIEECVQQCLTNVFFDAYIERELMGRCVAAFEWKQARDLFTVILRQSQTHAKHSLPLSSFLARQNAANADMKQHAEGAGGRMPPSPRLSTGGSSGGWVPGAWRASGSKSGLGSWVFRGVGRCLESSGFDRLVELSLAMLDACARKEDYRNGRLVLQLSVGYFREAEPSSGETVMTTGMDGLNAMASWAKRRFAPGNTMPSATPANASSSSLSASGRSPGGTSGARRYSHDEKRTVQYLRGRLKGVSLWDSLLFWEHAIAETLSFEQERWSGKGTRSRSPSSSRASPRSRGASGNLMWEAEEDMDGGVGGVRPEGVEVLLDVVKFVVVAMLEVGAGEDRARALVGRVVVMYGLDETREEALEHVVTEAARPVVKASY